MRAKGKPAACKRDGLSDLVGLQAQRVEDSPTTDAKQARRDLIWSGVAARQGISNAEFVFNVLKSIGTATVEEMGQALADMGARDIEVGPRLNSLVRRGSVTKIKGSTSTTFKINPDADLQKTATPNAPPSEMRMALDGEAVIFCMFRPRVADGVLKPSTDKLCVNITALPGVIARLRAIEAEARALGLIGGGA